MELLQLRYFLESAKSQSFAKTAEKHWVPASSVSASIKRLEDELGCKLFDRNHNSITLNENGKLFQKSISYIFDELDGVTHKIKNSLVEKNQIKLLVKSMRNSITTKLIEYGKAHPNVVFNTDYNMANYDFSSFDVIIDEYSPALSGYEKFEYESSPLCLRASKDNPFCDKPVRLIDLRHQPFITMGEHSNLHKILVSICNNAGFSPRIVLQTNDTSCLRQSIDKGLGIALSRNRTITENSKPLNVIDLDERQTVYAFFSKDKLFPTLEEFLIYLKKLVKPFSE